jgi:hypothetical protein
VEDAVTSFTESSVAESLNIDNNMESRVGRIHISLFHSAAWAGLSGGGWLIAGKSASFHVIQLAGRIDSSTAAVIARMPDFVGVTPHCKLQLHFVRDDIVSRSTVDGANGDHGGSAGLDLVVTSNPARFCSSAKRAAVLSS